jgi:hypothetical protein
MQSGPTHQHAWANKENAQFDVILYGQTDVSSFLLATDG